MAGFRDPKPTCQHNNAVSVKDGTLNLTRTPRPTPTGLDSIPGTKVVWESDGHRYMTTGSLRDAQKELPPEMKEFFPWLLELPQRVVEQDWSWANAEGYVFGINPKGGQVPHFMKDEHQSDLEAFNLSTSLILASTARALRSLRSWYVFMREHPKRYRWGLGDRQGWGAEITDYIAPALHTLQDSFSPAHVRRSKESPFVMLEIYAWDKDNKVHHSEFDSSWKGSPLGEAAKNASTALIKCMMLAASRDYQSDFRDFAESKVVGIYLQHAFSEEQKLPQRQEEQRRSAFG